MPMPIAVNSLGEKVPSFSLSQSWGEEWKSNTRFKQSGWPYFSLQVLTLSTACSPRALQKQRHGLATPRKNNFQQWPDPLHKVIPAQPSATQPAQDVLEYCGLPPLWKDKWAFHLSAYPHHHCWVQRQWRALVHPGLQAGHSSAKTTEDFLMDLTWVTEGSATGSERKY